MGFTDYSTALDIWWVLVHTYTQTYSFFLERFIIVRATGAILGGGGLGVQNFHILKISTFNLMLFASFVSLSIQMILNIIQAQDDEKEKSICILYVVKKLFVNS